MIKYNNQMILLSQIFTVVMIWTTRCHFLLIEVSHLAPGKVVCSGR
jgi:hypothetical protein